MKFRFLRNFPLGCFFGGIFSLCLAWIIDESVGAAYQKNWVYLFSALTTLAAAALALSGTFSVIHNQKELAASENEKSLLAARAVLPPVLSSLYKKAEDGFSASLQHPARGQTPSITQLTVEQLKPTAEELTVLQDCIKYSDENTARWLSLIISDIQILNVRLESSLFTPGLIKLEYQIARDALNWSLTKAMINHLFEFSRTGKVPTQSLPRAMVTIPSSVNRGEKILTHWDDQLNKLCQQFDRTEGWSSLAFQKRLQNPPD